MLPQDQPYRVTLGRNDLLHAVCRVAKFSDERSQSIRLQFADHRLIIRAGQSEVGDSEEDLPVEYSGPVLEIGLNAQYLADFLRIVDQQSVDISFKDAHAPVDLQPHESAEDSQYRYVVMPMYL